MLKWRGLDLSGRRDQYHGQNQARIYLLSKTVWYNCLPYYLVSVHEQKVRGARTRVK